MVSVDTELVLSLSTSHAPGVFEVLGLILPVQAQVHDDLRDDDVLCDMRCMRVTRITCLVPL